jgi:hypothetical protein
MQYNPRLMAQVIFLQMTYNISKVLYIFNLFWSMVDVVVYQILVFAATGGMSKMVSTTS